MKTPDALFYNDVVIHHLQPQIKSELPLTLYQHRNYDIIFNTQTNLLFLIFVLPMTSHNV